MEQRLLELVGARRGHFRLESGYHGGLWLDLDHLFVSPPRILPLMEALARRLEPHRIEAVCGPLVGGAFLAQVVASLLGIEFYYAERFAPSTPDAAALFPVHYRIPSGVRELLKGRAVAVVDDAISAGSAVLGTLDALYSAGARPVAVGALLVLGDRAEGFCRERGVALEAVARLPYELWLPGECDLCAAGVPLEDMGAPPA
jgi:orotate phosphoribosyltransferase